MRLERRVEILEMALAAAISDRGSVTLGKEQRKRIKKEGKKIGVSGNEILEVLKPVGQILLDKTFEIKEEKSD